MAKFIFWLKCVYYFRRTPRGMDRFFSDLLLSLNEYEPTKVLDYLATTNGGSHIYLQHDTDFDVALNYSIGAGLGIQVLLPKEVVLPKSDVDVWLSIYQRSKQLIYPYNRWFILIRRLLNLKLVSRVKPLPLSRILESK